MGLAPGITWQEAPFAGFFFFAPVVSGNAGPFMERTATARPTAGDTELPPPKVSLHTDTPTGVAW